MNVKQILPNATLLALLVAALPVHAQQDAPTIQQLEQQLSEQQKMLEQTRQSLERLKIRMQAPGSGPVQGPVDYQATEQDAVGKAPPHPQEVEASKVAPILDQPGILTPRGRFAIEPSLQYDYSSDNQINLIGFSVLPAIRHAGVRSVFHRKMDLTPEA